MQYFDDFIAWVVTAQKSEVDKNPSRMSSYDVTSSNKCPTRSGMIKMTRWFSITNLGHLSQSRAAFQSFITWIWTQFLPLTVLLRSANLVAMVAIRIERQWRRIWIRMGFTSGRQWFCWPLPRNSKMCQICRRPDATDVTFGFVSYVGILWDQCSQQIYTNLQWKWQISQNWLIALRPNFVLAPFPLRTEIQDLLSGTRKCHDTTTFTSIDRGFWRSFEQLADPFKVEIHEIHITDQVLPGVILHFHSIFCYTRLFSASK